jgi:integrase
MRDPKHPAWPHGGERTELYDVADRWKWAYVDRYRAEHRARTIGLRRPVMLMDAVRDYRAERVDLVARSTADNDRTALAHLTDDFANAPVHEVRPQKTLNRLLREGYGPYTVEVYSAYLSGFFRWCGLPYEVELPKWQRSEPRVWNDHEVLRIRDFADDLLTAVDCGLYMGLRWGEIQGVRWEDVDLASWTVRVRRQKDGAPLKSRRVRTALILPGWEHAPASGFVAVRAKRQRLTTLLRRARLEGRGVGWHSFRHTYARIFLERKADMRLLQASLGHASVTTTEVQYNHLLPDRAAAMARKAIHGI